MGPETLILTALPADQRPAAALALALRDALGSPNTVAAGEADAERAAEMLETLQRLGFALLPAGALAEIAAERQRQIEIEGFAPEHDDQHQRGELADAASCYAWFGARPEHFRTAHVGPPFSYFPPFRWPWAYGWWKPRDRRHDLVRAAALIMAELERLARVAQADVTEDGRHG